MFVIGNINFKLKLSVVVINGMYVGMELELSKMLKLYELAWIIWCLMTYVSVEFENFISRFISAYSIQTRLG